MDARLTNRLGIRDTARISVKLLRFDHCAFKLVSADRQIKLASAGLDAYTPATGALVKHHATGVIAQAGQL